MLCIENSVNSVHIKKHTIKTVNSFFFNLYYQTNKSHACLSNTETITVIKGVVSKCNVFLHFDMILLTTINTHKMKIKRGITHAYEKSSLLWSWYKWNRPYERSVVLQLGARFQVYIFIYNDFCPARQICYVFQPLWTPSWKKNTHVYHRTRLISIKIHSKLNKNAPFFKVHSNLKQIILFITFHR